MTVARTRCRKKKQQELRDAVKQEEKNVSRIRDELRGALDKLYAAKGKLAHLTRWDDSEDEDEACVHAPVVCESAESSPQSDCPICYRPYSMEEPHVPVVLSCETSTHTFCRSCLLNYALVQEDTDAPLACPMCRAEHDDVVIADLPKNDAAMPTRKRRRQAQDDESSLADKLKKHENIFNLFSALRMYTNSWLVVSSAWDGLLGMLQREILDREMFVYEGGTELLRKTLEQHPQNVFILSAASRFLFQFFRSLDDQDGSNDTREIEKAFQILLAGEGVMQALVQGLKWLCGKTQSRFEELVICDLFNTLTDLCRDPVLRKILFDLALSKVGGDHVLSRKKGNLNGADVARVYCNLIHLFSAGGFGPSLVLDNALEPITYAMDLYSGNEAVSACTIRSLHFLAVESPISSAKQLRESGARDGVVAAVKRVLGNGKCSEETLQQGNGIVKALDKNGTAAPEAGGAGGAKRLERPRRETRRGGAGCSTSGGAGDEVAR